MCTSLLSPVRADWFTVSRPCTSRPSAGMPSPLSNSTKSPRTNSSKGKFTVRPSRRTRQVVRAASSCSRRKARSLLYSDRVEIKDAKKMARAMPTVSNQPCPRHKSSTLAASAANISFRMGSLKLSSSLRKKPVPFCTVKLPEPKAARLCKTSASESPRGRGKLSVVMSVTSLVQGMHQDGRICPEVDRLSNKKPAEIFRRLLCLQGHPCIQSVRSSASSPMD